MYKIKEFKILSKILVCLGLSPSRLKFRKKILNYLQFSPILIQIGICFFIFYNVTTHPHKYFITSKFLDKFLDSLQLFRILLALFLQVSQNIFKRQLDDKLNKAIESIEQEISAKHYCCEPEKCSFCQNLDMRRYLYKITLYILVAGFLIDYTVFSLISKDDLIWANSLFIREFSATMIRIMIIPMACNFFWVCSQYFRL